MIALEYKTSRSMFKPFYLYILISTLNMIILLTFPLSRSGSEADEYD